jgi:hypothetical protein
VFSISNAALAMHLLDREVDWSFWPGCRGRSITEAIDVAEKRATVAGNCYWTRFVAADPSTFVPMNDSTLSSLG